MSARTERPPTESPPTETRQPHWRHPMFRIGARDMVGLAPGLAAWGLITGVAMVKSGLSVPLAILMSLTVFAGTAQLAALPIIAAGAPIWVVWATAFCINLRFVIFSTQWRPYFAHLPRAQRLRLGYFMADMNYIVFTQRFPRSQPAPGQVPYYWGGVFCNWFTWQVPSMIGILLGERIPTAWGLSFAGTMALLALTCALLGSPATWVAASVAGCAAVAAYALPLKLNLLVAIAAAVAVGVVMDHAKPQAAR
jgi:predicted branched-subunit amino acid permease